MKEKLRLMIIGMIVTAALCLLAWWAISFVLYVGPAVNFVLGGAILGLFAGFTAKLDRKK